MPAGNVQEGAVAFKGAQVVGILDLPRAVDPELVQFLVDLAGLGNGRSAVEWV
jgi:hypothetical protein